MRRLRLAVNALVFLAVMALSTGTALANSTVNVKLTGVGGNNAGGVYTYPYYLSINGAAPIAVVCDTYDNEVVVGETWKAYKSSLLSGKGIFGNELTDYKAAGLIFKSILSGSLSANVGNYAIWGLFSKNAQNNAFFESSDAATIENEYLALAKTAPNSAFAGLFLYSPISGTQSWGGTAQEYIGYSPVPEPGSLVLFGTGLIGLAGIVRRKIVKA